MGKYDRSKFTVITINRVNLGRLAKAKKDSDSYNDVVERLSEDLEPVEEVRLKTMPKKQARRAIHAFIMKHPGCLTSDIIEGLELEPGLVLETLDWLKKKKRAGNEP